MKRVIKSAIGTSMLAFALGSASPVSADYSLTLPAGLACDFDLEINATTINDHYVIRTWTDEYGNPVRMITAGKGDNLEFVNLWTGATFSISGNGSVSHTTYNYDGSQTVSAEGHNVLIFFPTDFPPGPWTKQFVGQVVYTVGADGIWRLQKVSGRTVDICAALSE